MPPFVFWVAIIAVTAALLKVIMTWELTLEISAKMRDTFIAPTIVHCQSFWKGNVHITLLIIANASKIFLGLARKRDIF